MDYAKFIENLVKPLVLNTEDVQVTQFLDDEELITVQVKVNPDDLGRVIGKKGRIADSIRTLAYACAARESKRIAISFEEE